jgi:hypothetical protein
MDRLILSRIESYFEDIREGHEVACILGAQAGRLRDLKTNLSAQSRQFFEKCRPLSRSLAM